MRPYSRNGNRSGTPIVIDCPDCAGRTVRLDPCRCTRAGDRFLIDDDPQDLAHRTREAYRDCELCRGAGVVSTPCFTCRRLGWRRAELVLTVANLDTGAVASAQVVPANLDPRQSANGRWVVDLTPRVRDLAARVRAAVTPDELTVRLPREWRPDLPETRRHELAARAIAELGGDPWRVLFGRSAPPAVPDPGDRLVRLCHVADLLLLDLVIELRREGGSFSWHIRYEVPGCAVPDEPRGWCGDLPAALARTDVVDALYGLGARGLAAPARLLRPDLRRGIDVPAVDVDQVERRTVADAVDLTSGDDLPGAQAIWREGRWWHTGLRPGDPVETLVAQPTGQVASRSRVPLHRGSEPPDPSWLGDPIGWRACPDCRPDSRLRVCLCTLGGRPADPRCPDCCGAGMCPSEVACRTCGGSNRLHRTVAVTMTDLRHRVVHLTWHAGTQEAAPVVATQPGGKPVVQLPERYRLASWAAVLGVRAEDLTLADGGAEIGRDLCGGYATLPWRGADPVGTYVTEAARALPAARLIVVAAPPEAPPLAELIRLALGLNLALLVGVRDLRHQANDPLRMDGIRWSIDLLARSARPAAGDAPSHPSLPAAIGYLLEYLEVTLAETVPADAERPIPVPSSAPIEPVADPVPALERLAAYHAGEPVTVRFTRAGCAVYVHHDGDLRLLAEAVELPMALAALGLSNG